MNTAEVRAVVRTLVDACRLTVLISHGNGDWEQAGPVDPEVEVIRSRMDHLSERLLKAGGWSTVRTILVEDRDHRSWVLQGFEDPPDGEALLAVGPLGADGPWTVGQILELLRPVPAPAPVASLEETPWSEAGQESDWTLLRRQFQPPLLDAIRQGDRETLDLLLERLLSRWNQARIPMESWPAVVSLTPLVTLCVEAAIQAGLDVVIGEEIGKRAVRQLASVRSLKDALVALFPTLRVLAEAVAQLPFRGKSSKCRAMLRYVMDHLERPVTLSETATHVGLSPNYAGALLRKEAGEGFLASIHRLRVNRARLLLRSTDLTITEISRRLGYRHSNHFARSFRKLTGQAPGDFRYSVS